MLVALIGFGICLNAQDVITLKNGTDINALVQKIGDVEIEYKKFDNPNGPNYTLKKSEILMIRYENGSKDIFSEEVKKSASALETTKMQNTETINMPENAQSRKDVIVKIDRGRHAGFQTKITHISDKHIFYRYEYGKEKRINQKRVAFTLTFDEKFKQEKYPKEMSLKDFLSLPTYNSISTGNWQWVVFGTHGTSNLSQLNKLYPDIYNDYAKGIVLNRTGGVLGGIGVIFTPLLVAGLIVNTSGVNKISSAFINYYQTCVDLEVCTKYGIVITPYNTSLNFKK